MLPGVYHLILYRGDTARLQFKVWRDQDKTEPFSVIGAAVTAQIRERPDDAVVVELICETAGENIINVTVPAATSAKLQKQNVWDLQLTWPSGDVQTLVQGAASAGPDVTRAP